MFHGARAIATALTTLLIATALAACGSGGNVLTGDVVARVGKATITKAEVSHWMGTLVGGDIFEITGVTAPRGLLSEPEDDGKCVALLKGVEHGLDESALMSTCHELHAQIRSQAITYLIDADVEREQDAEQGINVSPREVEVAFAQTKARDFPTESEVQRYLAQRDWSLSDELFLTKRNLLGEQMLANVEHKVGATAEQPPVEKFYKKNSEKWLAKTTCRAGYVVEGCKEYTPPNTVASTASPAAVIGQLGLRSASAEHTSPDLECKSAPAVRIGDKVKCEKTSQQR